MNLRAAALALIIFLLLAAPGLAVTYKSTDGTLTLNAGQIDIFSDKLVATGKAHIHWVDAPKKTTMDADAEKMVVTTMPEQTAPAAPAKGAKAAKSARMTIKSAVLTGPVKLIYVMTDANGKSTITANADNADFDGKANLAHLTGNVRIVNDNPAMFSAPASMTGDKATLNLKPSGPDDFRFRVESSPGVSNITVTPKAKPEADKNK
jgi:lipopolysaccharide export system protein LptA